MCEGGVLATQARFASTAAAVPSLPASRADREKLLYDVVIVGAGPAGLSAAIKLKQICKEKDRELSVCVLDKGAQVGSHILSGNVFETKALDELLPAWKTMDGVPIKVKVPVASDRFRFLATAASSMWLPSPKSNKGNYVVSLSEVCRWLAEQAEGYGVDVLPGFSASEVLYDWDGRVRGVATRDVGVSKSGAKKGTFSPGVEVLAPVTLLGEGCRGSLSESVIRRFHLRADSAQQTYGLGLKEVWEVPSEQHSPGTVVHTLGFPLSHSTYGGGFVYHMDANRVALGLVVGLDYSNPYLNMHSEFQRWKTHPEVRKHIEGGTCIGYGARALNEGGWQSIPKLSFPGGALIGCSAGFVNVPKIKGTHTAMKSGMLAAEAAFRCITGVSPYTFTADEGDGPEGISAMTMATGMPGISDASSVMPSAPTWDVKQYEPGDMSAYDAAFKFSWVADELRAVRNVRPGFRFGLLPGLINAALETAVTVLGKNWGKTPWTLSHGKPDHERLSLASAARPIDYPKPDGTLTFDIPKSLYLSATNHDHDQPCHLTLVDPGLPERLNHPHYDGPESRYCPAGVYEYVRDEDSGRTRLVVNAQNCLHCKTCDIKDPRQNIRWTVPEGGGGPGYTNM